jgi:Fe-S-cluster containining protein
MSAEQTSPAAGRTELPVVHLDATRGGQIADAAAADVHLKIGEEPVRLRITVPTGPARPRDLLPVFQGLTDVVVGVAVRQVEREGKAISCRAGCGACCRQLVPVAPSEARDIARLVEAMPEPRRAEIKGRFAAALERLGTAGLLDQIRGRWQEAGSPLLSLGLDYFHVGVPCPFLEDESCSIHPDRPLSCREFLVTSPAEHCARPTPETVKAVRLPAHPAAALREVDRRAAQPAWVPLILALEWAAAHPDEPPARPGPVVAQEFFAVVTRPPDAADGPGAVADWVTADNLRPLLTALGWVAGTGFPAADWPALERDVQGSHAAEGRWVDYALAGDRPFKLRLARDPDAGAVRVRAQAPPEVEPLVRLAVAFCQRFRVRE